MLSISSLYVWFEICKDECVIQEIMLSKFELGYNGIEKTHKHLLYERWRDNWSQYIKQMVQEILFGLQELHWSGKIR